MCKVEKQVGKAHAHTVEKVVEKEWLRKFMPTPNIKSRNIAPSKQTTLGRMHISTTTYTLDNSNPNKQTCLYNRSTAKSGTRGREKMVEKDGRERVVE